MKTKASIVVMSHLSDAQECMRTLFTVRGHQHINFAKYLIFHLGGDLTVEIDADEWFAKFEASVTNKEG